ncbi:Lysosomal alpha-mannosidase [Nymphon striatum]|nr:Lysosomal alpha-mannosidase [Nymphon striatum]
MCYHLTTQVVNSYRRLTLNCPAISAKKINVHLISHTHDDVGWLKTVDQYFYGSRNNIQNAGVQYIIDSVIESLLKDPSRRFIYVESAFFWRWWREQSDLTRHLVKGLVQKGQLEFIGGGWSMNDEAASHYNAIIDNLSMGFRMLNRNFGTCGRPKVAWQIDPFGHSREQASIFAQMGYDGLFFGRLDYRDKATRQAKKTMEVVWQGSDNLGSSANLFTGVLPNMYQPPSGFCFDNFCVDPPMMDDKRLEDYNVPERVKQFMEHVNQQKNWYRTNNIVMTMGSDFNYQNANTWFKNLDKLIKYVNELNPDVNVFYSTPSCYLNSLHKANLTWSIKKQDFLPYASDQHSYWSGYFSSRPTFKRFIRYSNNFLQICKQLDVISRLGDSQDRLDLDVFKQAMGVVQHHDAVTGTAKQHVTDDYYKRLYKGIESCQVVVNNAYKTLMFSEETAKTAPSQVFCNLLNITQCEITEKSSQFSLTIYNPIGRPIEKYIRLPVTGKSYVVTDVKKIKLQTQLVPIPDVIKNIPGRNSSATSELIFKVKLPALGYAIYQIEKSNGKICSWSFRLETTTYSSNFQKHGTFSDHHIVEDSTVVKDIVLDGKDFSIENEIISISFSGKTGSINQVKNSQDGSKLDLKQSFYWYYGMSGNNTRSNLRASGAYAFRPNGTHPYILTTKIKAKIVKGPLVNELHQIFSPWISQIIRLYKDESHCEFEWLAGPIPIKDGIGKEIISRYDTKIKSGDEFFTDSNGREILKRIRNKRPDYKLTGGEPFSKYYLFTQVHRRLLHDDGFGVGEPLNETAYGVGLVTRGTHYLLVSKVDNAQVLQRKLAEKLFMSPWTSFSSAKLDSDNASLQFSALTRPLPPNVHLLTLEQWTAKTVLIRLEHFFEKTDDPKGLSLPAKVSLKDLFSTFEITKATEMWLDGVYPLSEVKRLKWKTTPATSNDEGPTQDPVNLENYYTESNADSHI